MACYLKDTYLVISAPSTHTFGVCCIVTDDLYQAGVFALGDTSVKEDFAFWRKAGFAEDSVKVLITLKQTVPFLAKYQF